ncbi:predicted protein, partial [Nematostella vectensis]
TVLLCLHICLTVIFLCYYVYTTVLPLFSWFGYTVLLCLHICLTVIFLVWLYSVIMFTQLSYRYFLGPVIQCYYVYTSVLPLFSWFGYTVLLCLHICLTVIFLVWLYSVIMFTQLSYRYFLGPVIQCYY